MQSNLKKFLPHAAAIVVFIIITLIYFKPLLSGKVLRQDDIARHKGMSKEILDYRTKHHAEPLWTNSMFGGMPAFQISTLYSGNWIGKIDEAIKLYLPHPGSYLFLYCLGFFILLLCIGMEPWLALVGSLAYAFSSYFFIIIEAGHNSKANALGYLPALIGGIILLYKQKYWLGLVVTSLFTALEVNANHVQITYYGYILIACLWFGYFYQAAKADKFWWAFAFTIVLILSKLILDDVSVITYSLAIFFLAQAVYFIFVKKLEGHRKFFISTIVFGAATFFGIFPNAGNLLSTNEYGKVSTRGKSELTVDYYSVRAARAKAQSLDGNNQRGGGFITPGILNPEAREQFAKRKTTGLDKDYATGWSYGIGESFTLLIPDYKGGVSNPIGNLHPKALKKVNPDYGRDVAEAYAYYGDQPFTSGPVYIGAIVFFLAVLGMFVIRNPIKWPIFVGTLLTMALAWGNNFMLLTDFFMDHVPGYNKFRAVSMLMVIPELTLPLLAIMGIHDLLKYKWNDVIKSLTLKRDLSLKKIVLITGGVVGGFCLLNMVAPDIFNSFHPDGEEQKLVNRFVQEGRGSEDDMASYVAQLMPQIEKARKAILTSDAGRSLVFVVLGFLAIVGYLQGRFKKELLFAAIGIFVAIDMWTVDTRYLNYKSFVPKDQYEQYVSRKTEADIAILRDSSLDYRVLNLGVNTFNDASTSFHHKSIGGYHGAKLKKYQEIIDFHLDEEIQFFSRNAGKVLNDDSMLNVLLGEMRVVDMLNTKYFIIPLPRPTQEDPENVELVPMPNKQANGNAWFVKNLRFVADADSEIVGLYFINTKTEALLRTSFREKLKLRDSYSGEGSIKLVSYEPNYLVYESDSKEEQFAVFSEIYYEKGWNAYIDNTPAEHGCADYILRGMKLSQGKHRIEFKFEPKIYQTGNTMSMAGSAMLFVVIAAGLFMEWKHNKTALKKSEETV